MKILLNILLLIAIIIVMYNNSKTHAEENIPEESKITNDMQKSTISYETQKVNQSTTKNTPEKTKNFIDSDVFNTGTTKYTPESISDENTSLYGVSRYSIATFLVWKIYQERMEGAERFICEIPSCESEQSR